MNDLPPVFLERLRKIIPAAYYHSVLKSFSQSKPLCIRINTLKIQTKDAVDIFHKNDIDFQKVSWPTDVFLLKEKAKEKLEMEGLLKNGFVFIQSLSSMLPALMLDPKPNEAVFDACAAPGGKTSQMAALMENKGTLLAVEAIAKRFYKLKSILSLLGVTMATLKCADARKVRLPATTVFDKVLVDAPCSSEGRFSIHDKKTYAYWSLRKIKEMAHKQKGLLMSASRFLKKGGTLVYSTCTFAPEENEGVVDWLLKKTKGSLEITPISAPEILSYPSVEEWNVKRYDKRVKNTLRVLPTETMEGFFIAKFVRK